MAPNILTIIDIINPIPDIIIFIMSTGFVLINMMAK